MTIPIIGQPQIIELVMVARILCPCKTILSSLPEQTITCSNCGKSWRFIAGETKCRIESIAVLTNEASRQN